MSLSDNLHYFRKQVFIVEIGLKKIMLEIYLQNRKNSVYWEAVFKQISYESITFLFKCLKYAIIYDI